jgi:hypothetical protein
MQYRILGPLEVVDDSGSPAPGLGPPKQRASGAVDIRWSGGYLTDVRPQIDALRRKIVSGQVVVPHVP